MRTARIALLALSAGALSLSFVSCKNSSSDPSPDPQDTTSTVTGCKPTLESDLATGDTIHSYGYDTQGRISVVTGKARPYSSSLVGYATTFTYKSDGSIQALTVYKSRSIPSMTETYILSGGKFQKKIKPQDTTYYYYDGSQLTRIEEHDYSYSDVPVLLYQAIEYQSGLPSKITLSQDSSGVRVPYQVKTYTYDNTAVGMNPLSVFFIAPGLELVKINRMYTRETHTGLHDVSGFYTGSTDYTNVYDGAKASQISSEGVGSVETSDHVSKFTYDCR